MIKRLFDKYSKKTASLLLVLIIIGALTVGTTIAFLVTKTAELINSFTVANVLVTVNNDATVTVSQDSDSDAYIRVAVVVNFQDQLGNIHGVGAVKGTNYTLNENLGTDWIKGNDGYYYYKNPVAIGASTSALPVTATMINPLPQGAVDPTANGKYKLTVTYIASGVQASPRNAVEDVWNVTLTGNQITGIN
jgi:hypothetical protein